MSDYWPSNEEQPSTKKTPSKGNGKNLKADDLRVIIAGFEKKDSSKSPTSDSILKKEKRSRKSQSPQKIVVDSTITSKESFTFFPEVFQSCSRKVSVKKNKLPPLEIDAKGSPSPSHAGSKGKSSYQKRSNVRLIDQSTESESSTSPKEKEPIKTEETKSNCWNSAEVLLPAKEEKHETKHVLKSEILEHIISDDIIVISHKGPHSPSSLKSSLKNEELSPSNSKHKRCQSSRLLRKNNVSNGLGAISMWRPGIFCSHHECPSSSELNNEVEPPLEESKKESPEESAEPTSETQVITTELLERLQACLGLPTLETLIFASGFNAALLKFLKETIEELQKQEDLKISESSLVLSKTSLKIPLSKLHSILQTHGEVIVNWFSQLRKDLPSERKYYGLYLKRLFEKIRNKTQDPLASIVYLASVSELMRGLEDHCKKNVNIAKVKSSKLEAGPLRQRSDIQRCKPRLAEISASTVDEKEEKSKTLVV